MFHWCLIDFPLILSWIRSELNSYIVTSTNNIILAIIKYKNKMGNRGHGGGYNHSYVQNQLNAQRQAL